MIIVIIAIFVIIITIITIIIIIIIIVVVIIIIIALESSRGVDSSRRRPGDTRHGESHGDLGSRPSQSR